MTKTPIKLQFDEFDDGPMTRPNWMRLFHSVSSLVRCIGVSDRDRLRVRSDSKCCLDSANAEKQRYLRPSSEPPLLQHATPSHPSEIVTINISGMRFQTAASTLLRFPDTLLGNPEKCLKYYNKEMGEYFFDRHRSSFESILYFYQSGGHLKRPEWIPVDVFIKELKFFEMGAQVLDLFWQMEGYRKQDIPLLPKHPFQRKVWQVMEHPDSSVCARVFAFFSVFVIAVSTLSFCLETLPELRQVVNLTESGGDSLPDYAEAGRFEIRNPFFVVEVVCICWFTVEFIVRIISCPSKLEFCKSFLNVIDFIAILPFFVNLILSNENSSSMSFAVLRVLRLVRVFRIFKLSRHSRGLQILGRTFRASIQELFLLIFFLCIGLVLFSSAIYFAESGTKDSKFDSIPAAFWYVVVTMTTVGYGDLVPVAPIGKLVGSLCAIVGVLVLALPVPVIVANFKHYYRLETRLAYMMLSQAEERAEENAVSENSHSSEM